MIVAFQIFVVVLTEAILVGLSVVAAARLKGHSKLPMQWQLDGTVTWMAPRRFALAFTPVLSAFVLSGIIALSVLTVPRPGQGWMLIPVTLFVCFTILGAHAFHMWMMGRTLKG